MSELSNRPKPKSTRPLDQLGELLSLAKKKQFPPKKLILFGRKRKAYTVVLHCFNHIQQFQKRPDQIQFHCKECLNEGNNKTSITVKITPKADFTNLNKHLNIHKKLKNGMIYT
jgi:hypothetical protein